MAKIDWTDEAIEDLESIRQFIARDSKRYAQEWVKKLVQSTRKLKTFPDVGRDVPETRGKTILKEIIVGDYRIMYHCKVPGTVTVVTVIHGARIYPKDN